jgi:hypothetical protein
MKGADLILRAESVAFFLAGIGLFLLHGGHPLLLLPLLLVPDISMAGYLGGPRLGALTYNAVHNWVLAVAVLGAGLWFELPLVTLAGAILLAHVGMDRALGYGLKLPSGFRDTHLGRIGRS